MWNSLLSKKACGWGTRWARSPRGAPKRGGPGEGALRRRGEVIDGFLTQTCGRLQAWRAEDFHHFLKVQSDVVMEKAWGYDGCPRASVAVKQSPVVEGQVGRAVLHKEDKRRFANQESTGKLSLVRVCRAQRVCDVLEKLDRRSYWPGVSAAVSHELLWLKQSVTARLTCHL